MWPNILFVHISYIISCVKAVFFFFFFAKLSGVFIRTLAHPYHMTLVIKTAESLAFQTVNTVIIRNERTLCSLTELQRIHPEKDLSLSKNASSSPRLQFATKNFFQVQAGNRKLSEQYSRLYRWLISRQRGWAWLEVDNHGALLEETAPTIIIRKICETTILFFFF